MLGECFIWFEFNEILYFCYNSVVLHVLYFIPPKFILNVF